MTARSRSCAAPAPTSTRWRSTTAASTSTAWPSCSRAGCGRGSSTSSRPTRTRPGHCASLERRQALVALAREHDLLLVEDDPYGLLRFEGEALPTLHELDGGERVIYCSSFTKTIAPGVRTGYLVLPEPLVKPLAVMSENTQIGPNTVAEAVVWAYCDAGRFEPNVARATEGLRARRDAMEAALRAHFPEGSRWTTPRGGYFFWVDASRRDRHHRRAPARGRAGRRLRQGSRLLRRRGRPRLDAARIQRLRHRSDRRGHRPAGRPARLAAARRARLELTYSGGSANSSVLGGGGSGSRRQGAIAGLTPGLLGVAAAGAAAMTIAPSRGPAAAGPSGWTCSRPVRLGDGDAHGLDEPRLRRGHHPPPVHRPEGRAWTWQFAARRDSSCGSSSRHRSLCAWVMPRSSSVGRRVECGSLWNPSAPPQGCARAESANWAKRRAAGCGSPAAPG